VRRLAEELEVEIVELQAETSEQAGCSGPYRWSDRRARWLTLGLLKRGPGPFMSDETAERIAFVGGWILAGGGLLLLLAMLVQA
jgi:hypothetical protein